MTYLVTWKGNHNNIDIGRYEDKASAKRVLDGIEDPSIGGVEVDTELDLAYTKTVLVDLFNKLGGPDDPQVAGFPSKAEGQKRVFARIEELALRLPMSEAAPVQEVTNSEAIASEQQPEAIASEQGETEMAAAKKTKSKKPAKAKTAKAPKVAKAKTNGNGLPREGSKNAKLLGLISRPGGATLAEMLKATGWKECRGTASVLAKVIGKKLTLIKEEGKAKRWEAQ